MKALRSVSSGLKNISRVSTPQMQTRSVGAKALHHYFSLPMDNNYSEWSHEQLVARVYELEKKQLGVKSKYLKHQVGKVLGLQRPFDTSKYSTRLVALKVAYLGQRYHGFEYTPNNKTPYTTVEEELWKALVKTRLIFPANTPLDGTGEVSWEGTDYSKCGRTDKGVSAFGQVIGIRVRSNRPLKRQKTEDAMDEKEQDQIAPPPEPAMMLHAPLVPVDLDAPPYDFSDKGFSTEAIASKDELSEEEEEPFDPINDEIPYPQVLNRVLPPDIRVLAWCPTPPPEFSARFMCRERRYRYFFTQPAFAPMPGAEGLSDFPGPDGRRRREGWLDIEAMREGAKHFEGVHDFRNFCKVDPSKQLTTFERKIHYCDIKEVDPRSGPAGFVGRSQFGPFADDGGKEVSLGKSGNSYESPPKIYQFIVHGSAFLWHQVRHMAQILFLIGQGVESPSIVPALLDVTANPRKPNYEMADDAPLVLWDAIFPEPGADSREDSLDWVYVSDTRGSETGRPILNDGKYGAGGLVEDIWAIWRKKKMDEILAGSLLDIIVSQGCQDFRPPTIVDPIAVEKMMKRGKGKSQKVFDGGNSPSLKGVWIPVLQKQRMETPDTINERYASKKGLEPFAVKQEKKAEYLKRQAELEGEVKE